MKIKGRTALQSVNISIATSTLLGLVVFAAASSDAETITVGKAKYRTDLPVDGTGKARRLMKAKPSVSNRIRGAVPTNDWCSSLVWPKQSPHSLPMFAHPLAIQARESGLGLGYNPTASVTSSRKDGKLFQSGTNYRFHFRESMIVGLENFSSPDCVLDAHSDWTVTALWRDNSNSNSDKLRATFGHGLPFVYFERESQKPLKIRFTAAKVNRNEEPVAPLVFRLTGITAKHTRKNAMLQLAVNAGKNPGIGSKARLRYDFDGDGKTDRTETWKLMATDPVESSWEKYSDETRPLDESLSHGEHKDFKNGTVTLEFWKCFGKGGLQLKLADCHIKLPIENGKRFLANAGNLQQKPSDAIARLVGDSKAPKAKVFYRDKNIMGVTVNKTHYGLFAPQGSKWSPQDVGVDEVTSNLAGKNYFSIATLPDDSPDTIQWFQKFAYAFVTDTRVSYEYDQSAAHVKTTFKATTDVKEGTNAATVFALYRHQHLHLVESQQLAPYRYESPRGTMKVVSGNSFSTATPFLGVLPSLPCPEASKKSLAPLVDAYLKDLTTRKKTFQRDDTYWNGKELGKISEVIQIADQLGKTAARDQLVNLLEGRIEDWSDANDKCFFYYDPTWSTLIGYPDSYGSADQLNDHHFHYSYFIKAAATIAQFDPEWVRPENYGGMIDLLIRNCANYDREDHRFPWMRFFDPYAGHSWASGHAGFASGNNQESSSESMNFATSLILYGQATQNKTIRDLGIYWHATEAEAIRNYWFDNDRAVFPNGFDHRCVGMIWGDGGTYGTWWTANPEEIHGINYLPITGGSLYLGRDISYTEANFHDLIQSNRNFHNGGFEGTADKLDRWQDVIAEYRALSNPAAAIKRFKRNGQGKESEFGESKVHTLEWISSLAKYGHYDASVAANHPTAVTFVKDGKRTYVVYNAAASDKQVSFSDKATFTVARGLHTFEK